MKNTTREDGSAFNDCYDAVNKRDKCTTKRGAAEYNDLNGQKGPVKTNTRHKTERNLTGTVTWRPYASRLVNLPHRDNRRTPLMLAAIRNSLDIAEFLINYCGADVRAHDVHGCRAADLAAMYANKDVVDTFLANMPDGSCNIQCPGIQQWVEQCSEQACKISQRDAFRRINENIIQNCMQHSHVSIA